MKFNEGVLSIIALKWEGRQRQRGKISQFYSRQRTPRYSRYSTVSYINCVPLSVGQIILRGRERTSRYSAVP
jgi:hypothetical protein